MLPYVVFEVITYDLNENINFNFHIDSYMLYNM